MWQKQPGQNRYRYVTDGRTIAEVQEDGHLWHWRRFTTINQDGVPGASGSEQSRAMAQREALRGLSRQFGAG
ncbi:hypothetical protein [Anatilimnocola floriformis]|uniref:hypothetical protein n=1 Tax=Anatilimnocola floriformis TaxID=2948575 RepID=UPI0020C313B7|nr:hypothetical protein [Anatilimnocola floriformis]